MSTALTILLVLLLLLAALALWMTRRASAAGKAAEAACPPIGRFIDVAADRGRVKLHYLDKGPANDDGATPPILMIHGLSGTLRHFSATIQDDLARDHRTISVDRPGMGYSESLPGGPSEIGDQAAALDALLTALSAPPPLVIGHSLGGSIALALALRRPVAGLLLLAPATHPFKAKPPTPDQTIDSAFLRRAIAATIGPSMVEKTRPQNLAVAFGPQQPPPEFSVAAGGILMMRPRQIETTLADAALLRPSLEAQSGRYAAIEAPITVLFGDQDGILHAADHIDPLVAKAPQTKARILPGLGHMLPFVEPDLVASAAREMTGAAAAAA